LVTVGCVVANSIAAFEKLPVSTTRTNICIASNRSMRHLSQLFLNGIGFMAAPGLLQNALHP
jgi:hypothetical protein